MIRNYLKIAFRNLIKNRVYSFINIAGLAVGLMVALLIGLWMHDELTYDTSFDNYSRLALVYQTNNFNNEKMSHPAIPIPLASELSTSYASDFDNLALTSWEGTYVLAVGETKIIKNGMYAQGAFPGMFGFRMKYGTQDALLDPSSMLISESVSKALFGDENPVGKLVKVDNQNSFKVAGVFEDLPFNTSFHELDFLLPWGHYVSSNDWVKRAEQSWEENSFQLFAQLSENASLESVSARIQDVIKTHRTTVNDYTVLFLHPMQDWYLRSEFKDGKNVGGRIQYVWLFGIIGLFVLLLACINFMNLSTARSEKRAKEIGIRKAIGSVKGQLIIQFLSESLLMSGLGLVLALVMVQLALPSFNELASKEISVPWLIPYFWAGALAFALLTGLVAGSYPAFYLSSFQPIKVLKGTFRAGRWAALPRKVLVITQFTVSIALIIGTIIVFRQIQHAKDRPIGYDREGLIQVQLSPDLYGKYMVLRDELLQTGVVYDVSQSSTPLSQIRSNQIGFNWEGKDPESLPVFGMVAVTHDFGNTTGWKLKEGRDFSRSFSTDTSAIIINEAAADMIGIDQLVGKVITQDGTPFTVIGIVENLVMESPYTPTRPTIFRLDYNWASHIEIKLKPGVPTREALARVETVFKKQNPGSPFEYTFADQEYENKFRSEERIGKLATIFAVLAIFISCLGLFGLASFVAEQRTKEIGVRKVLGASVPNLWALLSKDFVVLVVVSCLIAVPLSWYFLNGWLSRYEYRTELAWWVFLVAGLGAMLITLLTVSYQAIKASSMNPVKSLRSE